MNLDNLQSILKEEPAYRTKQVYQALYINLISDWDQASGLPKSLRDKLRKGCPIALKSEQQSSDEKRTVKAVLDFDGDRIECVLMKHKDRNTVCVSSQVGCPLACDFCATGKMGFKRNLKALEIVAQVLFFARLLKETDQRVSNVVFMGMGEPFLNYAEVLRAVKILNDKEGLNIGARKISISTVGVIDGINKLSKEKLQVNLAVSLHASNDKLRNEIMPVNRNYPLKSLMSAVSRYIAETKRQVLVEYVLLKDVNDSAEQAEELAKLLKDSLGSLFSVNIISYNISHTIGEYLPSEREQIKKFKKTLESKGILVTERYRFGRDIKAACGQLATENHTI